MPHQAQVNAERLLKRLEDFAAIGATPAGGVNRQALSVKDREARRLLAELTLARVMSGWPAFGPVAGSRE